MCFHCVDCKGSGLSGRGNIGIILIESFQPFDKEIENFGVIFGDKKFNAGGIKSKDLSEGNVHQGVGKRKVYHR